ncbi:MAG: universal stress protein [Deltaproteobacteria bacterium]|nr:universal stress protein [Deltaproteobacteria bacterium]
MPNLRKILVAFDFSENSRQALGTAIQLSRRYGSELLVMTVIERSPDDAVLKLMDIPKDVESQLRKKIDEEIHSAIPESDRAKIRFEARVHQGKASLEIVLEVDKEKPDLVVMGTKGRTGLKHVFLGSVAEQVVRRASAPVWVCRGTESTLPKRILVPVDFSDYSRQAMDLGIQWAKSLEAEVFVLNVVDSRDLYFLDPLGFGIRPSMGEDLKKQAEQQLKEWTKEATFPVKAEARLGIPVSEIQDCIQKNSIDLVLISTHGRTGLKNMLIGSVAEQTVRYSSCSVMTICPPAFGLSSLKLFEGEKEFEDYMRCFRQ